jgi:Zn-dependent protease
VTDDAAWPPPAQPPGSYQPPPSSFPPPQGPPTDPSSLHAQEDFPYGWRARLKKAFAPLIAAGAFLAKFGIILLKLKSVVFLGSAAVSIAAYAQLWGWKYAVGFVALIFIHEMGHVVALRLRGIHSAVTFLPFLGAFTAWEPRARSPYQEAETALAGPLAGAVAALAVGYYGHHTDSGLWLSLAFTGLVLTLFNLAPVRPLDGGRVVYLLNPWIWVVGIVGLLGYDVLRPGLLATVILALAGFGLYHQIRDRDGQFAAVAAHVEAWQRRRISVAFVVLVAATLIGMQWTYVERHLS